MKAAELIGVAPITLKRWLLTEKVDEVVARSVNNWRCFDDADVYAGSSNCRYDDPAERDSASDRAARDRRKYELSMKRYCASSGDVRPLR